MHKRDGVRQTPRNWVPIVGHWSIEEDRVTYTGPASGSPSPVGICLADVRMTEGDVSCRVQLTEATPEGRILLGYRSLNERYVMAGLGGWRRAFTVGEYIPGLAWRGLALEGSFENFTPKRWYTQRVELRGQRLRVSVDSVPVLKHVFDRPVGSGQVGLFAFGNAPVEFDSFTVERRRSKAFVVMKFAAPFVQLYKEVIQPIAKEFGIDAKHVGEAFGPGIILDDIVQGIIEAEVVIIEITPVSKNENVFYELGYAHALNKPTILLAQRGRKLPFDVSGYRVLFYQDTTAGKKIVKEGLRKHLKAIRDQW
jgi:hypothetical protein